MPSIQNPCARLTVAIDAGIARLTLANPSRKNAIDLAMWQAIPGLMAALAAESSVRCIVISGEGSDFSAGADIAEFDTERATPAGSRSYEAANVRAFAAVADCPRPVIAAIRGICFGAGAGLASACDLRLAAADSIFAIPAARLGVAYPPEAFASIVALVGAARTKELFFTGRRIDAGEAATLGLVNRIVPNEALDEAVGALARTIAGGAPLTLTAAKRAIDAASGLPTARSVAEVQALADACFDSADFAEGRAAFRERRQPAFQGK